MLMGFLGTQMLRSELAGYEVGMFEQNPLTYIFMKNPDIMARVYFDNHDYCMNCWCVQWQLHCFLPSCCQWSLLYVANNLQMVGLCFSVQARTSCH